MKITKKVLKFENSPGRGVYGGVGVKVATLTR